MKHSSWFALLFNIWLAAMIVAPNIFAMIICALMAVFSLVSMVWYGREEIKSGKTNDAP